MKKIFLSTIILSILCIQQTISPMKQTRLNKQLFDAIQKNNLEKIKQLIEKGAHVNVSLGFPPQPLFSIACSIGNFEILDYLLAKGANVNAKGPYEKTPLHDAVYANNLKMVKYLIAKGAAVNAKNKLGNTPLHNANDLKIIKYLVEKKADINAKNNHNNTPLHNAIKNKQGLEIIKYLVDEGATVNMRNKDDETPLHYATERRDLDIVKYLVNNGADVNAKDSDGHTPFWIALYQKIPHIVRFFVSTNKVDINTKDSDSNTPLLFTLRHNEFDTARFFIEKGAHVNAADNKSQTPLYILIGKYELIPKKELADIAELLIDNSANINAKDKYNDTPLNLAKRIDEKLQTTYYTNILAKQFANKLFKDMQTRKKPLIFKKIFIDKCPICLELKKVDIVLYPCGHTMHKDCIKLMFKKEFFTCPICKTSIEKIEMAIRIDKYTEQLLITQFIKDKKLQDNKETQKKLEDIT